MQIFLQLFVSKHKQKLKIFVPKHRQNLKIFVPKHKHRSSLCALQVYKLHFPAFFFSFLHMTHFSAQRPSKMQYLCTRFEYATTLIVGVDDNIDNFRSNQHPQAVGEYIGKAASV